MSSNVASLLLSEHYSLSAGTVCFCSVICVKHWNYFIHTHKWGLSLLLELMFDILLGLWQMAATSNRLELSSAGLFIFHDYWLLKVALQTAVSRAMDQCMQMQKACESETEQMVLNWIFLQTI